MLSRSMKRHGMKTRIPISDKQFRKQNRPILCVLAVFAIHHAMGIKCIALHISTSTSISASLHSCTFVVVLLLFLATHIDQLDAVRHSKNCILCPFGTLSVCGILAIVIITGQCPALSSVHNQQISSIAKSNYYFVYSSQ